MAHFSFVEYTSSSYNVDVEISDEDILRFMERCKKDGLSVSDFRDELNDYLYENKWDYQVDRCIIDEDTEDVEMDSSFEDVLDEFSCKYEKSLENLGEFGNE